MIQVGSSPALLTSLDKGGIDAAVLDMPTFFLAEDKGYRLLAEPGEMDIVYLQSTLESSRSFLRKKLRIQSEQERDVRYLELSYNLLASKYYNETPYPSIRGVQTILDFVAQDEPKAKGADPKSFVDESFVREIDESGFIKAFYGR